MSEDLHEFLHHLRNWGVRDLFESPLLESVLRHEHRHIHQLFCDQRHRNSEKPVPRYGAGFGLASDLGHNKELLDDLWNGDVHHTFTHPPRNTLERDGLEQLLHNLWNGMCVTCSAVRSCARSSGTGKELAWPEGV